MQPQRRRDYSTLEAHSFDSGSVLCPFTIDDANTKRFGNHLYVARGFFNTLYATIGNLAYSLIEDKSLKDRHISLSTNQYYEVRGEVQFDFERVGILPQKTLPTLTSCKLCISFSKDYRFQSLTHLLLIDEIKKSLTYPLPIGFKQSFDIHLHSYIFTLNCEDLNSKTYERYGLITKETLLEITFNENDKSLMVCDKVNRLAGTKFNVRVMLEDITHPETIAPAIMRISHLSEIFFELFDKLYVQEGFSKKKLIDNSYTFSFNIVYIESPQAADPAKRKYKPAFQVSRESRITLSALSQNILIVQDRVYEAAKVHFEIISFTSSHDICRPYIFVTHLRDHLKSKSPFVTGQKITFLMNEGRVVILVRQIVEKIFETETEDAHKKSFNLASMNGAHFSKAVNVQATLVDNNASVPLKKMDVCLSQAVSKEQEEEIKDYLMLSLQNPLVHYQSQFILLKDRTRVEITLNNFQYDKTPETSFLGALTPQTELNLVYEKKTQPIFEDVKTILKRENIAGLSEATIDYLRNLAFMLGPQNEMAKALDLHPDKGILLKGPPGTGKTSIAKALAVCLNIPAERVTLISASEIISMWMGKATENILTLFKPARDDKLIYGDNAPLRLLIIDEIDALTLKRDDNDSRNDRATVATLLSEMGGLTDLRMIVVGTTNKPESVDEAFLRPGRFGKVLTFDLPEKSERRDILELYLNNIKSFVGSDINLDELAQLTQKMSGALLKEVVAQAKRNLLKKQRETMANFETLKINQKDIIEAITQTKNKSKDQLSYFM